MEERHSISEPRRRVAAAGQDRDLIETNATGSKIPTTEEEEGEEEEGTRNLLEWEVDILRDSVVVDTIVINSTTLPPRKNKKNGKILWCLPDTDTKLVSIYSCSLNDDVFIPKKNEES